MAHSVQMFLGTADKVYIIDKTEANPATINGHPAWASGAFNARLFSNVFPDLPTRRVLRQQEGWAHYGYCHEHVLCGEIFLPDVRVGGGLNFLFLGR